MSHYLSPRLQSHNQLLQLPPETLLSLEESGLTDRLKIKVRMRETVQTWLPKVGSIDGKTLTDLPTEIARRIHI